jgi:hypothetical protein
MRTADVALVVIRYTGRVRTLAGRAAGAAACVTLVLWGPAAGPLWDWLNHVHAAGKGRISPDARRIDHAVFESR